MSTIDGEGFGADIMAEAVHVEPVAWRKRHTLESGVAYTYTDDKRHVDEWARHGTILEPLYAAPQEPAVNAELLEVLQEIVALDDGYNPDFCIYETEFDKARSVIAKAIGGEA